MTTNNSSKDLLLDARWLLVSIVVPIGILILLGFNTTYIIWPSLSTDSKTLWIIFFTTYVLLVLGALALVLYFYRLKRQLGQIEALVFLFVHVLIAYASVTNLNHLISFSIPDYLVNRDEYTGYLLTAFAPGALHLLLVLIRRFTPPGLNFKAYKSFLAAVAVPVIAYLYFTVLLPLFKIPSSKWFEHSQAVLAITLVVVFLFFFIRTILIIITRRKAISKSAQVIINFLFGLLFPLLGLFFNNHSLTSFARKGSDGIFGDFNHWIFFAIATAAGITLLLPKAKSTQLRTVQYLAHCAFLPYCLYFFFIFLPFLPFSLIAIFIYGMGILMITPTILVFLFSRSTWFYLREIKEQYSIKKLITISILAFALLPAITVGSYYFDRISLHRALAYVYQPDLSKPQQIDFSLDALANVINAVEKSKSRRFTRTPILTPLYKRIVLDNLTLSQSRINELKSVFWGEGAVNKSANQINNNFGAAELVSLRVENKILADYNESQVHLTLTNKTKRQGEYITTVELPNGVFVTDYYLRIGDKDEAGLLTEKKAAMWIYQQITSRRRDPGFISYLGNNRLQLRVFPIESGQIRFTGFKLSYQGQISIKVDGRPITLGQPSDNAQVLEGDGTLYVSPAFKATLPKVKREPYYHFIVDASKAATHKDFSAPQAIAKFLKTEGGNAAGAKVSLVNFAIAHANFEAFKQGAITLPKQGGFSLNRALRFLIREQAIKPRKQVPVFVVISPQRNFECDPELSYLQGYLPDSKGLYFWLAGKLYVRPLFSCGQGFGRITKMALLPQVHSYHHGSRNYYLAVGGQPEILFAQAAKSEQHFNQLVATQGLWQKIILNPQKREELRYSLLKTSFAKRVLSPLSTFIVVETESQKRRLLKARKEILKAKDFFDYGEERRMSEPSFLVVLLLLCLGALFRHYRKQKKGKEEIRDRVHP